MTASPSAALPASIGRRAGAYAIDVAVAYGIGIASSGVAIGVAFAVAPVTDPRAIGLALLAGAGAGAIALVTWAIVYTAMQGGRGSVGQRALDLRLRRIDAASSIGFWRALWRNVVWVASCAIVVGWFTPLFDPTARRQGWHDRAANAFLVHEPMTDASAPALAPAPAYVAPTLPRVAPAAAPAAPAALPRYAPPTFASVAAPAAPPAVSAAAMAPTAVIPRVEKEAPADDLDATRTSVTVPPPAQRAALFADAPVVAVLTWDDGSRMAVYGRTLYGRNPAAHAGVVSVPVRDETLSLSKTHFEIGGDASGAWIADRHSTNGTVLVRDGGRHPLVAGLPTTLRAGDRLELGDRSAIVGSAS